MMASAKHSHGTNVEHLPSTLRQFKAGGSAHSGIGIGVPKERTAFSPKRNTHPEKESGGAV